MNNITIINTNIQYATFAGLNKLVMNSAICDPTEFVEGSTKYPLTLAGRIYNENAKIKGIMPAELTLNGINEPPVCLYILPPLKTLLPYWTGSLL